jgi:hypothetical protein
VKLAHITPIDLLEHTYESSAFLCLSNLVCRYPKYAEFYRQMVVEGKLVILDNPVHENELRCVPDWISAAKMLQPSVAIIPDVIDSVTETLYNASALRHMIREVSPKTRLMAVPHGVDNTQFLECAKALAVMRNPSIEWFGVSLERRLHDDALALQRRIKRVRILQSETGLRYRNIHLLGVSETAIEFTLPVFDQVVSADTSKFAVWWLNGTPVGPPAPVGIPYPGRKSLGGSTGYFTSKVEPRIQVITDRFLAENLSVWSAYAEGR